MKSQIQSSHNVRYRRTLRHREVQQKQITQHLENPEAQMRSWLRTEELMMTSVKESFQENSETEKQADARAQQLASL